MKAQMARRPREDFGRHVRTQFELSEAGENNLVLDELQYQLDILFGKGASLQTKVSSLNCIVGIFTSELPIGVQKVLRSGAGELLLQISPCLAEDRLLASTIALILAISTDNDGSFNPSMSIPVDMLSTLVGCIISDEPVKLCSCLGSNLSAPLTDVGNVDAPDESTAFRKKRKFGSAPAHTANAINSFLPDDIPSVVRQYGSGKAAVLKDSQGFGSQSSQSFSINGDVHSDEYWSVEPQPLESVASVLSVAPIVAPVVTGPGGFHRKRKMGSAALAPAITTMNPSTLLANDVHAHASSSRSSDVAVAVSSPAVVQPPLHDVHASSLRERFHTLFATFLCDKADQSHTALSSATILHMILLNRYLSARVAALASVKTDMFLSSDNPDAGTDQQPEGAESNKLSTQRSDVSSSLTENGLGGGVKYQAQAEALSQLQICLRTGGAEKASYLGKLCEDVHILSNQRASTPQTSHTPKKGKSANSLHTLRANRKSAECTARTSTSALWLALGILDSACFRCPQNQSYLAEYVLWKSDEQDTSLPHTLVSYLQQLTPQLLNHVLDQHHAELTQRAAKLAVGVAAGQIASGGVDARGGGSAVASPSSSILGRFGTPIAANASVKDCGSAGVPSTGRGFTTGQGQNQPELPAEWEKFRNLFPEIPVVVSHKVVPVTLKKASDTSSSASQDALWQDDDALCLNSPPKTPTSSKLGVPSAATPLTASTETEREVRAVVGLPEVCTAALKALVSLSNDCEEVAQALVHSHSSHPSQTSPQLSHSSHHFSPSSSQNAPPAQSRDAVSWAVAMLAWCAAWRCSLAASEDTHSNVAKSKIQRQPMRRGVNGALSPDETALERFVFDLMLYLQSLLTNLAEFAADAIADVAVWPCVCAYDIFPYLPEKTVESTPSASYLAEKCPLLSHILACKPPRAFGSPASTSSGATSARTQLRALRLPDLLVEVLHLEAMDFLVDLEETDEAINQQVGQQNPTSPLPQSLSQQSPLHLRNGTSPSSKSVGTPSRARTSKSSAAEETNMPVPVAELIVSAHAALLLHTLTLTPSTPTNATEDSSTRRCVENITSPQRTNMKIAQPALTPLSMQQVVVQQRAQRRRGLANRVRAQLPRGSWWLCVRVLKAFLILQGQTGILLLENLSPVLSAVQYMSRQDNPDFAVGTAKIIEGNYESPETQLKLMNAPNSASMSKSHNNKRPIDLTGELPGKIDFLDLWAEEAPPAKRATTSSDKSAGEWVWNGNDYVWNAPQMSTVGEIPKGTPSPSVSPAVTLRDASVSRIASTTSVDSLYKASFKPHRSTSTSSTTSRSSSVKSSSRAKSLPNQNAAVSPVPVRAHSSAPLGMVAVGRADAEPQLSSEALPRTSLSSARRFALSDNDEEEWAFESSPARPYVSTKSEKDFVSVSSQKETSSRSTQKFALSKQRAPATTSSPAHVTAEDHVVAVYEEPSEAAVRPKESGGWRAKRKTFGAPVKAIEVPPHDWFD